MRYGQNRTNLRWDTDRTRQGQNRTNLRWDTDRTRQI